ncbi:MAG: hypothetical protein IPK07_15595 [Deltaproteobacteria bacterium]|nr:hypothetical protein [Deltaproteobacteria bacterium]
MTMSHGFRSRALGALSLALALGAVGCGGDGGNAGETRFDGTWVGETSQSRRVELVIQGGRIAIFEIGYRVTAGGTCSRGGDLTLFPEPAQNWVRDGEIAFATAVDELTPADGTVVVIDGRFGDDAHLSGRIAIERDPPCSSESYLWSATRGSR